MPVFLASGSFVGWQSKGQEIQVSLVLPAPEGDVAVSFPLPHESLSRLFQCSQTVIGVSLTGCAELWLIRGADGYFLFSSHDKLLIVGITDEISRASATPASITF